MNERRDKPPVGCSKFLWGGENGQFELIKLQENVGRLYFSEANRVHWKIRDFFSLPQCVGSVMVSRGFEFAGEKWKLCLLPNGCKEYASWGWFGLHLPKFGDSDTAFSVRFIVVGVGRSEIASCPAKFNGEQFQAWRMIRRSEFDSRRDEIAPRGTLDILCEIRKLVDISGEETSAQRKTEQVGEAANETKMDNCNGNPSNETEETEVHRDFKISFTSCDRYKSLILGEQACDATFKVKRHEFPVHKSVLRASSPFFSRMFNENQDGVILVEGCDEEVFDQLLQFAYSSVLENVPSRNLPPLYHAAEKYGLSDLKQLCVCRMKSSLSEGTVCDVIRLAKLRDETELLERAMNFFARNAEEILSTEECHNFIKENTVEAIQLLIEAFKLRPYKREGIVPNEFSEMLYKKLVALTLHPNNR